MLVVLVVTASCKSYFALFGFLSLLNSTLKFTFIRVYLIPLWMSEVYEFILRLESRDRVVFNRRNPISISFKGTKETRQASFYKTSKILLTNNLGYPSLRRKYSFQQDKAMMTRSRV
jgi:hypothetical protein